MLTVRQLSKSFPGVRALDDVALDVAAGEVVAVVGENGAGKSTLMKVLAGIHSPDVGEIRIDDRPVRFAGVRDALAAGVVLVHQELNLAGGLSVTANLFLGRERTVFGWLDRAGMRHGAEALLARVGLNVSPDVDAGSLSIGQQQLVEIARALGQNARLLILDEPTSSLSQRETETLFGVIADLKRAGVSVLYISHRLAEVKAVADRVVVLRDGRNAGELGREEISHDAMVRLMVGRDLRQLYPRSRAAASTVRLEARQIRYLGGPANPASFELRAGEVVGMAGLVGAGRTELAEAIFGIRRVIAGAVVLDGQPLPHGSPRAAIRRGLLLAPEDRRLHGLILGDSVADNLSLPNLDQVSQAGFISPGRLKAFARRFVEQLRVKTPTVEQPVGLLSGGNQQKVVFGKWLARGPKVLILDEPTRGVDVGARGEIYALIDRLAADGVAVLMISSDLEEILGMSDRVIVMHDGRIAGELQRGELSEEAVMRLATGRQRI